MNDIFHRSFEGVWFYEKALVDRARHERSRLRANGTINAIEDRPTLRMTAHDKVIADDDVLAGLWTWAEDIHEDDLPRFSDLGGP